LHLPFVDVALRAPGRRLFTYALPASLSAAAVRGVRVVVPVRRTHQAGIVWRQHSTPPLESAKTVADLLDERPIFPESLLKLAEWLSEYYHCGLGEALFAMLPAGLKSEIETVYRHDPDRVPTGKLTPSERKLCFHIAEHPGATRRELLSAFPAEATADRLEHLVALGTLDCQRQYRPHRATEPTETAIQWADSGTDPAPSPLSEYLRMAALPVRTVELERRFPGSARQIVSLSRRKLIVRVKLKSTYRPALPPALPPESFALSQEQSVATREIIDSLGRHRTFLLQGVTGSGKTEVYIRSLVATLEQGRSALYLVPEIGLADHLLIRLAPHFESQVAVLHSGLTERERARAWKAVASGERRLVVGTRSACLAPIDNLGLVIVDEEQDPSLKQDQPAPRYHGRDVAIWRAQQCQAVCVLGTATPSLESWHHARSGKYQLLRLPERVGGRALPKVEFIDRRAHAPALKGGMVTGTLARHIEKALEQREQSILFLNRRGFSGSLRCGACGFAPGCPDCSVTYTFHRERRQLRCHHCGRAEPAPAVCSACGGSEHTYPRAGTQQVERELHELFPTARIARLDLDTAGLSGGSRQVLSAFGKHEVDILLGTQMVTKGLHFPSVSLVGILNTDMALDIPDFRSAERLVQQVMQVAGRAGRGELPGCVYAQTYNPQAPVFEHLLRHDFDAFADAELETRRQLGFPPFARCIAVWVQAEAEGIAEAACLSLARRLGESRSPLYRLLGPAPAPLRRLRRHFRWHFLLLTRKIPACLLELDAACSAATLSGARVMVDVDPVHLL
jgi:primosomal protein N' (replication factor Y)